MGEEKTALKFSMESSKIRSPTLFLVSSNICVYETFTVLPKEVFIHAIILLCSISTHWLKNYEVTTGEEFHPLFFS